MFSEELKALAEAVNLLSQQLATHDRCEARVETVVLAKLNAISQQVARFDAKLDTRNGQKLLKQFKRNGETYVSQGEETAYVQYVDSQGKRFDMKEAAMMWAKEAKAERKGNGRKSWRKSHKRKGR